MKTRIGLVLAIVALSACRVEDSTSPRVIGVQSPLPGLSDGSSGGNPDFFFFQPLVANPLSNSNIDAGAENPFLAPYAIICEITFTPGDDDCVADVTPVVGGIPLTLSGNNYSESWRTSDGQGLDSDKFYRIEVFATPVPNRVSLTTDYIEKFRYGYRDIDPDDGPPVSACTTEDFCKINNGSTIPIKVRIERFASCPETEECVSEVVRANQANHLKQPSGNQITLQGETDQDFFLNFDVCTTDEENAVNAAVDLATFGLCLKTETPFTGQLNTPAILSICEPIVIPAGYSHDQKHQIALHHFDTQGGTPANPITKVEALSEANNCLTVTGDASSSSGFSRLARAVAQRVTSYLNPRPLYAAVALDVGGGGFTDELGSLFKLALPAKFEYVNAADAQQFASPGSMVTLSAKVTDLQGNPVLGARVRWSVQSSPGNASLSASEGFTDGAGVAQVVLTLPRQTGTTIVHAAGKGIADARETGCTRVGDTNPSCNGSRPTFDPFSPLNSTLDGVPQPLDPTEAQLAAGTRLEFVVITGSRR